VPKSTELLANPALDLDPMGVGWTQNPIQNVPGGPFPIITSDDGAVEQSAPYKIWLGGITGGDTSPTQASVTDQVFQDFVVPANTTQLVLTGFVQVGTQEDNSLGFAFDSADVSLIQTNGTPIEDVGGVTNLDAGTTWIQFTHTFTANVSGQTVRLRFTSTNDDSFATSFYFDTLSVQATHCP
jgi:hypothetical protein